MSIIDGLTSAEVKDRFVKKQYNQSSRTKTKTIGEILIENVLSVFNFIIGLIIIFFAIFLPEKF